MQESRKEINESPILSSFSLASRADHLLSKLRTSLCNITFQPFRLQMAGAAVM